MNETKAWREFYAYCDSVKEGEETVKAPNDDVYRVYFNGERRVIERISKCE